LIVFGPRGVAVGHVLGQSAIFTQLYLFISWTHFDYLNINIYSRVWAKCQINVYRKFKENSSSSHGQ